MNGNLSARPPGEHMGGTKHSADGLASTESTIATVSTTKHQSSSLPTATPQKNKARHDGPSKSDGVGIDQGGIDKGYGGSASVSSVNSGGTNNSSGSRQSGGNNMSQQTNRNQRRRNRNKGRGGGGEGRGRGRGRGERVGAGGADGETSHKTDGVPPRPRVGSIASTNTQGSDSNKEKAKFNVCTKNFPARNSKSKTQAVASDVPNATKNDKTKGGRGQGKARAGASSSGRGGEGKVNRGVGKASVQLPQAKVELRHIVFSHLTKYQRILEDLTRQDEEDTSAATTTEILDPTPGEASAMALEDSKKAPYDPRKNSKENLDKGLLVSDGLESKNGDANGKDVDTKGEQKYDEESNGEEDVSIRFLPEDRRQKRRNAYKNAKCMLMMVQDVLDGSLSGVMADLIPSLSKNVDNNNSRCTSHSNLKEKSSAEKVDPMWQTSNVHFELDVTSVHNMLLEWTFPPKAEGFLIWNAIELAKTKEKEASANTVKEQDLKTTTNCGSQPPTANVIVRILYMIPPKRSRRHGVVPGRIYLVLTPSMAPIQVECQRQKSLEQAANERYACCFTNPGSGLQHGKNTQINGAGDSTNSQATYKDVYEGNETAVEETSPDNKIRTDSTTEENFDKAQTKNEVLFNDSANSFQPEASSTFGAVSGLPPLMKLDKGKALSLAQLTLESAEEKIRGNLDALGLSPSIQLTQSMNTKTFPEPRYERPATVNLNDGSTEVKSSAPKHSKKKRGVRGDGRYENTLHLTDDYQTFLNMYTEKQGAVKFVVDARDKYNIDDAEDIVRGNVDESLTKTMNAPPAGTGSSSASANVQQEKQQPVAAIVKHLQEKRQEEEAKKKALKKQRKLLAEQKRTKKPSNPAPGTSSTGSAAASKAKTKKHKSTKSNTASGGGGGDDINGASKKASSGATTSKPKVKRGGGRGDGKTSRIDTRKPKTSNPSSISKKSGSQKSQNINGIQTPVLLKKNANGNAVPAPTEGTSGKSKTSLSAPGQGNKT